MPVKQSLKIYEEHLRKGTMEQLRKTILEVIEKTFRDCRTDHSMNFHYFGTEIKAEGIDIRRFIFSVSSFITLS